MSNASGARRPPHREWHGKHLPWFYRPQAFRWLGTQIVGINFLPLAQEMRAWMMQRGSLSIVSAASQPVQGGYTNPYTFSGTALGLIMGRVVNGFHDFTIVQNPDHDEVDAEIERLRLYNEVLLYAARFCEVTIKQLLFCTTFHDTRYKRLSLGGLLEKPCPICKEREGKKPHSVSFVGSLAHPFRLCLEFDHCAMDHMDFVNRLRNTQAAHSGLQALNIRSVEESKAKLLNEGDEVLSGFIHMLSHLAELEERMLDDLAEKSETIVLLKANGLAPEECNFKLVPGEPFVFHPYGT